MSNKLTKYLSITGISLCALYAAGYLAVALNASSYLDDAVKKANQFLQEKYQNGSFDDELILSVEEQSSSILGKKITLSLNTPNHANIFGLKELHVPVEISYGFLNAKAKFDGKALAKTVFVDKGFLNDTANASGVLNLRVFPYALNFKASASGEYSDLFKSQGLVKTNSNNEFVKFDGSLLLQRSNSKNQENIVLNNIALPQFAIDKFAFKSSSKLKDNLVIPESADLLIENCDKKLPFLGRVAFASIKFLAGNLNKDSSFDLFVNTIANTEQGKLSLDAKFKDISALKINEEQKSFIQFLTSIDSINHYATNKNLSIELNKIDFVVDGLEDLAPRFSLEGTGDLQLPNANSVVEGLSELNGNLNLEVKNFNEAGRSFVKNFGFGIFAEKGDSLVSDVIIDHGNVKFN